MADLHTVTDFPYQTTVLTHVRIPMSDGVELAARIWLPVEAESTPMPAILEYIPYRQRDMTRGRDAVMHPYFAGHGYVCVRVDLRGSGDSGGILVDEYTEQELCDGEQVIRWLSEQPWCDGNVGMIGISWGGFNGLQIAMRQPPALKGVVAVCATDDRYGDDVHYMGGCLLGDNLSWATVMFAYGSLPPDPRAVGRRWREMWMERLENNRPWVEEWLRHPHRGEYWQHGSVCEDWGAIQCPVLAASGWADGYSNAVFRLMKNLDVPRLGLIGPWSHKYPHQGVPGPAIGFLQEALRWWDHWLKGKETGAMEEPMLRMWIQHSVAPVTHYHSMPGHWIGEPCWPSPNIHERGYVLDRGSLLTSESVFAARKAPPAVERRSPAEITTRTVESPLSVGLFAGKWCSYSATPDLPHDQREEDGGAMVFETEPLTEPLDLVGAPQVELELSSSKPVAMVAARLSDVHPDDKARRITYGILNLAHRDGHEQPEPLLPGQMYRVCVVLNGCAQNFPIGHRIRLSLSTSYWPLAWPPPEPVRLAVRTGTSKLILPLRQAAADVPAPAAFQPPEGAQALTITTLQPPQQNWWVIRELSDDISTLEVVNNEGTYRIEQEGIEVNRKTQEWYSYQNGLFESPRGETHTEWGLCRDGWDIQTITNTVMSCTPETFSIQASLEAFENGEQVFFREWETQIPRKLL